MKSIGQIILMLSLIGSTQAQEPLKEEARAELRAKAQARMKRDLDVYSRDELAAIESLYQIANQNWRSDRDKARLAMENLVLKYKKANRTGCALLYLGQLSRGKEREEYLRKAMADHGDCFYGDGVQVGAFARYLLIVDCRETGKEQEAKALADELAKSYSDAISHSGVLLSSLLSNASKQPDERKAGAQP